MLQCSTIIKIIIVVIFIINAHRVIIQSIRSPQLAFIHLVKRDERTSSFDSLGARLSPTRREKCKADSKLELRAETMNRYSLIGN